MQSIGVMIPWVVRVLRPETPWCKAGEVLKNLEKEDDRIQILSYIGSAGYCVLKNVAALDFVSHRVPDVTGNPVGDSNRIIPAFELMDLTVCPQNCLWCTPR